MSGAMRYIGIAKKAGRLVFGTDMVCDKLRRGGRYAVFAASDISETTKKKLTDKCAFYGAELIFIPETGAELGHGIGKTGSVAAVYIDDGGLSSVAKNAAEK